MLLMGSRRKSRELAMQFLYNLELNHQEVDEALKGFWEMNPADDSCKEFAEILIKGTNEHQTEIDAIIDRFTINWDIERIAIVDRNVLRIGIYEMLFRDDIPPVVSINEAVDIAKKFSTAESGKFVNGILDKVKIEVLKK
jgi:transcription antitermination protein NusB